MKKESLSFSKKQLHAQNLYSNETVNGFGRMKLHLHFIL